MPRRIRILGRRLRSPGEFDILEFFLLPSPLPTRRGIDLRNRSQEVRKLFFAGFASQVIREGFEPEEVLQEIYLGIIARNNGINPYNPATSSFGHYVHMVCRSVWLNYRERANRHGKRVGATYMVSDGQQHACDPADVAVEIEDADTIENRDLRMQIRQLLEKLGERDRRILTEIMGGGTRKSLHETGVKNAEIRAALAKAKRVLTTNAFMSKRDHRRLSRVSDDGTL